MICDDEPDLLHLFGQALKSKYNVIQVSSGKSVVKLEYGRRSRIDVACACKS
jgi:hypothetical protein